MLVWSELLFFSYGIGRAGGLGLAQSALHFVIRDIPTKMLLVKLSCDEYLYSSY